MCIIDRREEAHREKGDMYLEKGMDGEGSLQYVGSGGLILRGKTRGGPPFDEERGTSYLHIKQSTYLICKIKIIYLI